jgi:hypothetical protein
MLWYKTLPVLEQYLRIIDGEMNKIKIVGAFCS